LPSAAPTRIAIFRPSPVLVGTDAERASGPRMNALTSSGSHSNPPVAMITPPRAPTSTGPSAVSNRTAVTLQAAFLDYVHEVEHAADRLERLEKAIDDALTTAPPEIQEVVAALQALRGIAKIAAISIVAEVGSLSRFHNPRQLMSYSGLVSSEYSSGNRVQRGAITKTGNAHLRRVLVEAAWAYQHKPWIGGWLAKRQQGLDEETKNIAWKAQWRLCTRYKKLAARGKNKPQIVTAVGRELLGFIWAIAVRVEQKHSQQPCAA
jgi:transposase